MGARGTFVFPIHDLDVTGRDARFPVTSAWLRGALEGCEMQPAGPEGLLEVHLTKTGNEVLVQGHVDVRMVIPCARCLKPVELRPHMELALLLFPGTASHAPRQGARAQGAPPNQARPRDGAHNRKPALAESGEFSPDDAEVDTYEGDEVVLDRFVREAILLESPTFPLCSEACEGIRPASEAAPEAQGPVTDPRLLPLLELAKRRNWKE
jgi:uncharacterized protein